MPEVPGQRWSCHSCGKCCRGAVVHLFDDDLERIDRQGWVKTMDVRPYVRMGGGYVLNKTPAGACVFLDKNNRCKIHSRFGEPKKPLACRVFPFSARAVTRGWQVSLRFDCPSIVKSEGGPLDHQRAYLADVLRGLEHSPPAEENTGHLQRGLPATSEETEMLLRRFKAWLSREEFPLRNRLFAAARLTAALNMGRFKETRGRHFGEMLDSLFATLPTEIGRWPAPCTSKQRGLLRQLAFAHSKHVSHEEARANLVARVRKRWEQLRGARRFLAGRGPVPDLPGCDADVTFEQVEAVRCPAQTTAGVEELLSRYLTARLEGRSVFGDGYYGWPIFAGLGALWLALAATGWIARYLAAVGGRETLLWDDVGEALGIVDRAATRVPSLGTSTERVRLSYLVREDGLAALVGEYAPLALDVDRPAPVG